MSGRWGPIRDKLYAAETYLDVLRKKAYGHPHDLNKQEQGYQTLAEKGRDSQLALDRVTGHRIGGELESIQRRILELAKELENK